MSNNKARLFFLIIPECTYCSKLCMSERIPQEGTFWFAKQKIEIIRHLEVE
jgi:hypothetical protein